MQIGARPTSLPAASDLASALQGAAERLGQRPAVTVLSPAGREEQGFVSLRQWAAKGAHLLELDHQLEPGDRIVLSGPPGWLPAAVCLAAWWVGVTVTIDAPGQLAVAHEHAPAPRQAGEILWYGHGLDGGPIGTVGGDVYVEVVQSFPDQPPASRAAPEAVAVVRGGRSWTHRDLLDTAGGLAGDGPLGLDTTGPLDPVTALIALAVRPVVTGRATVVVRDVGRAAAAAEQVRGWIG